MRREVMPRGKGISGRVEGGRRLRVRQTRRIRCVLNTVVLAVVYMDHAPYDDDDCCNAGGSIMLPDPSPTVLTQHFPPILLPLRLILAPPGPPKLHIPRARPPIPAPPLSRPALTLPPPFLRSGPKLMTPPLPFPGPHPYIPRRNRPRNHTGEQRRIGTCPSSWGGLKRCQVVVDG